MSGASAPSATISADALTHWPEPAREVGRHHAGGMMEGNSGETVTPHGPSLSRSPCQGATVLPLSAAAPSPVPVARAAATSTAPVAPRCAAFGHS